MKERACFAKCIKWNLSVGLNNRLADCCAHALSHRPSALQQGNAACTAASSENFAIQWSTAIPGGTRRWSPTSIFQTQAPGFPPALRSQRNGLPYYSTPSSQAISRFICIIGNVLDKRMRSWDQAKALWTNGKGGWDYKWKGGGRRVLRSRQWFLLLPPLEGEDKWELQQVLQQGNPAWGSAAALLQPSSSLLQKQSTGSHLPPAVCCPGQQPISTVVWTSLSGPFSTNIWDWGHHLAKGQSQHLLRSPAWRT